MSNEEVSAQLWLEAQLDADGGEEIANLIRLTDHLQRQSVVHPLKDVMLGVDLAYWANRRTCMTLMLSL